MNFDSNEQEKSIIGVTEERSLRYVNAYAVSRHYGGPEEGGWWYDAGSPLSSIAVYTDADEVAAKALLLKTLGPEYEHQRSRYSVIGEDDLEIYTEEKPAAAWPTERPHYE